MKVVANSIPKSGTHLLDRLLGKANQDRFGERSRRDVDLRDDRQGVDPQQ